MCDALLRIRMNGKPFRLFVPDKYSEYFISKHERCDKPEILSPYKKQKAMPVEEFVLEDEFDSDVDFENEIYLSGKSVLF